MCKFTYLGYAGCDEPERHYLIRREKCSAKAHLKHWCAPNEQEETASTDEDNRLNLECPMCADVPVIYDQPLLEIAHSRRSVLPAPHYDGVSGKYSRLPRHHAQYNNVHANNFTIPIEPTASLVPKPLNPARMQYDRSASESAVDRIKESEVSPDYKLPAATYIPSMDEQMTLPATSYMPQAQDAPKRPMPLSIPQPMELTPPSSREASLSPPQSRMGTTMRAIPPGESNRRELESIRERQRAAVIVKNSTRPATPQNRPVVDRSRSGSESSTSSSNTGTSVPPPPPPPRMPSRKPSTASSTTSSASTYPPSQGSSAGYGRPQHHRKDSTSTSTSAFSSSSSSYTTSRSPPQEPGTDRFAAIALLRSIGLDRTASPERGRRPYRRERGGSSSERSDSPSVWRPTISPPQLQQDSLGMAPGGPSGEIAGSFKQRLVPFAPSKSSNSSASPNRGLGQAQASRQEEEPVSRSRTPQQQNHGNGNGNGDGGVRQATLLRLYPNKSDDEKVARAALDTMFHEEQKALYAAQASSFRPPTRAGGGGAGPKKTVNFVTPAGGPRGKQHPDEETLTEVDMQTVTQIARSGGDPYNLAGVGRRAPGGGSDTRGEEEDNKMNNNSKDKMLPSVPSTTGSSIMGRPAAAALRRIRTGQVKTVTVAPPRPPKRANTADDSAALTGAASVSAATNASSDATSTVRVKGPAGAGGPLFRFAGVGGGSKAQEFEIVSGVEPSVNGRAF